MNSFFHKYSAFCCPIRTVALLYFNRTYWKNCVCIFNFIYWLSVQTIIFNYPNSTNRINERFSFLTAKINLLAKSKFQQLIGKHTNFGTFLFLSSLDFCEKMVNFISLNYEFYNEGKVKYVIIEIMVKKIICEETSMFKPFRKIC